LAVIVNKHVHLIDKICFIALALLLFWLPIPLASNRLWAWSLAEAWVALLTLCIILNYRQNLPWHRIFSFKWLFIPLVLFQLWCWFQTIPLPSFLLDFFSIETVNLYKTAGSINRTISIDIYSTTTGLFKGVAYSLFAFVMVVLVNSKQRVRYLLYVLILSGTYQAVYGALEILLNIKSTWILGYNQSDKANGTFIYQNHFANYILLTICLGIGLIVGQLHESPSANWFIRFIRVLQSIMSPKMLVRLCLVIMVIALVMSKSRMANTALFSVTIIGGFAALFLYKNRPRILTVFILSIFVIDTLAIGAFFGVSTVVDRLESSSITTETRSQAMSWTLDIIRDFPLTGTGLGSFYTIFPKYSHYNIGYYNYAHNDYLQFFAEVGIPATLMLGGSILYALYLCLNVITTRNSKQMKGTAFGCFLAILAMLIHISVDFNLQPPANVVSFIAILVLAGMAKYLPATSANRSYNKVHLNNEKVG
jgi:O-antigen ligase